MMYLVKPGRPGWNSRDSSVVEDMMVISALKHVANAASNAVHSATNSTGAGHGHTNSGMF